MHPDSPVVVPPLDESVRSIAQRRDELIGSEAELSRALADTELQLQVERAGVIELTDVLTVERRRADELCERLDAIERTVSWRLRTVALPLLRPIAHARRWIVLRWRSSRSGERVGGTCPRRSAAR